jgi:hypothetical protein
MSKKIEMTPRAMLALAKRLAAPGGEWYRAAEEADGLEDQARLASMDEGLPVVEDHPQFLDRLQEAVEKMTTIGDKLTPEVADAALWRAEWVPPEAHSHAGPRYTRPWEG